MDNILNEKVYLFILQSKIRLSRKLRRLSSLKIFKNRIKSHLYARNEVESNFVNSSD